MKDNIYICRMGDRSSGKVHAFAVELERIANERRELFISDLMNEINRNFDLIGYRISERKKILYVTNPYSDYFRDAELEFLKGKAEALASILNFIDEQKKLFTYHDSDSTGEDTK